MRLFELVLLVVVAIAIVVPYVRRYREFRHLQLLSYLPVIAICMHLFIEGYRWQMLSAYALTLILFGGRVYRDIRKDRPAVTSRVAKALRVVLTTLGLVLLVVAGGLSTALPVFELPKPTGIHPVGTARLCLEDCDRNNKHGTDAGDCRNLSARLWYPAAGSPGKVAAYLEQDEARAIAQTYDLPSFFFDHLAKVTTHSHIDAQVADGLFPLILYSPSGFDAQATALCEELASNGYIVASVNHPYWNAYSSDSAGAVRAVDKHNSYYQRMWKEELSDETGRIKDLITRSRDLEEKRRLHQRLCEAMPTEVSDIKKWAKDLSFAVDWMQDSRNLPPALSSAVDFGRIGIVGFSKGGAAAAQFAILDSRVQAGINLDGFMFGDVVDQPVPCPFMFVHGEPFLPETYINDLFFERASHSAFLAKIRGSRHANFSDLSLFGPLITAGDQFGDIDGELLTELLNGLIVGFFDSQMKDPTDIDDLMNLSGHPNIELFFKPGRKSDADTLHRAWPGPYLGQYPPGSQPKLFAPGVLPVDGIQHCFPAFAPDGREVFWMQVEFENDQPRGQIWHMKETDGAWSLPELAPFSGEYDDHAPVFSRDGRTLYFASSRPGSVKKGKNIWYVKRDGSNWGEPVNLDSPPNTDSGATQATFASDGTVYFIARRDSTQWGTGIYRSRYVDGRYAAPEPLDAPIATHHADVYPFIAPDESYLLFGSSRPGGNSSETDLYVSFSDSTGVWSEPVHLDPSINNGKTVSFSCVSHDGKYLFFNRFDENGTDKFYWVDAGIIEKHRPKGNP